MILGVGVDLCHIVRIRRSVTRFGKYWLDEVFTEEEQERLGVGDQQAHRAAIGFALKEACSKAIGTGFASGVQRQDFAVTIGADHCSVVLTGTAKRRAMQLCPTSAFPLLQTHFRSSESWVSALAVLALEGDDLGALRDHLVLP
jgi:phosphopantethiene--protein transferase domain